MKKHPRIPIAWSVRWSQFRQHVVPYLVFLVVLVAVVFQWRDATAGTFPGLAEAAHSLVSAPQNAVLDRLLVEPFARVEAGQPLAVLLPADSRISFDLWQAELALGRLRAEPSLAEANAMDFERLRAELLRFQAELEVAKVNLERAEREVARYAPLREEKLLSEDLFELSRSTRDALRAEVTSKAGIVALMQKRLGTLESLGVPDSASDGERQQGLGRLEQLRSAALTNLAPFTLHAPRAGMVQDIYRQGGEHVVLGEPLFRISPERSDRIVGYMRQPYLFALAPGLKVDIITRERPRRILASEIAEVGAGVVVITNSLAIVRPNVLLDSGLPFVVRLPADVNLRPGEVVDLRVYEDSAPPPAYPRLASGPSPDHLPGSPSPP